MNRKTLLMNLRIGDLFNGFLVCSPWWGRMRLYIIILLIWGYVWTSNILFGLNKALETAELIRNIFPLLHYLPNQLVAIPIVLFFPIAGIKFLLIPIGIILYCLWLCSKYVNEIHAFKSVSDGFYYICSSLFALFLPKAIVDNTELKCNEQKSNWLYQTGEGPGYLDIRPNNAVVIEKLDSPSKFLSNGKSYISRFERIAGVIDLKDRMVDVPRMSVMTRDRVSLCVNEFSVWYRIHSPNRDINKVSGITSNPYPYSDESLRSLHYNQLVTQEGKFGWEQTVIDICAREIANFINSNEFDTITSLNKERLSKDQSIQTVLQSSEAKSAMRQIGTEITRHDFIEIDISEDYLVDPKLNIWEDKWKGKAMVTQAEGEVKKLTYQELGLHELRMEFLNKLGAELTHLNLEDSSEENIQYMMSRLKNVIDHTYNSDQ